MEDSHPHVSLGADEVHDQLALVELEVEVELDELVEELVELDVLVELRGAPFKVNAVVSNA